VSASSWTVRATTNALREKWAAGQATFGGWSSIGHPYAAELLGRAGFDWVGIDSQHGQVSEHDVPVVLQALAVASTPAIVRVGWNSPEAIMRGLDSGANGIIIPMISSAADARSAVGSCKYHPLGSRSWGPNRAALGMPDYSPPVGNASTLCVVMIETPGAVEQLEEILAVDGVDAVFVGPGDLAVGHGYRQSFEDERLVSRILEIRDACKQAGVIAGIYAGAAAQAARWAAEGFQLIALSSDSDFIVAGAEALLGELASARQS
jgi:4-hydroxy-2-oxoheptanedioate aldolase